MNATLSLIDRIAKDLDRLYVESQEEGGAAASPALRWLKPVRAEVGAAARRLARAERAYARAAATAHTRDARACRAVERAYAALRGACGGDPVALLPLFPCGPEPYVRGLPTERPAALRRLVARIRGAASPPWPGLVALRATTARALEVALVRADAALALLRAAAARRAQAHAAALTAAACVHHHLTDYLRRVDPRLPAALRAQSVWCDLDKDLPRVA